MPITGLDFVSLPATDLERARVFYRDVLGLKPGPQLGDEWAEFDLGPGPALGVDSNPFGSPAEPLTSGVVTLALRAFDAVVAAAQCHLLGAPGGDRALVTDPDGNVVVLQPLDGMLPGDGVLALTSVPVAQLPRAREFYETTLGLSPEPGRSDASIRYKLPDGSLIALDDVASRGKPFAPLVGGSVGLRTSDLEATFERLKAQGFALADHVIETPVCHVGFVRDTEGNVLTLHRCK